MRARLRPRMGVGVYVHVYVYGSFPGGVGESKPPKRRFKYVIFSFCPNNFSQVGDRMGHVWYIRKAREKVFSDMHGSGRALRCWKKVMRGRSPATS